MTAEGKLIHNRTIAKHKIDKSLLTKVRRPSKYRYAYFIQKSIDVYLTCDGNIVFKEDLSKWLEKEDTDNVQYLQRINGYLKKHKVYLQDDLKRDVLSYPKQ